MLAFELVKLAGHYSTDLFPVLGGDHNDLLMPKYVCGMHVGGLNMRRLFSTVWSWCVLLVCIRCAIVCIYIVYLWLLSMVADVFC